MEFRIAADELKKALHRAQGIVERKTTMPILSNVLVNATKTGVTVTAFDLDIGIVSRAPGRGDEARRRHRVGEVRSSTSCRTCPRRS